MRQWFSGTLEGQYVGTKLTRADATQLSAGEHFRFEVTRGTVHKIQLAANDERPAHPRGERVVHQTHIAQLHLIDALGRGRTVRAAARDVRITELRFSYTTRKNGKTYGRISGKISGWFQPPPLTQFEETQAPARTINLWASDEAPPTQLLSALDELAVQTYLQEEVAHGPAADGTNSEDAADTRKLAKAAAADLTTPPVVDWPFFLIAIATTLLLVLVAHPAAPIMFAGVAFPLAAFRRLLIETLRTGPITDFLAAGISLALVLLAGYNVTLWREHGCHGTSLAVLVAIMFATLIGSALPRSYAFLVCLLALGFRLFELFGLALPGCQ